MSVHQDTFDHEKNLVLTQSQKISGTTARYIKNLSDLINLFGSLEGIKYC